ncbi:hypothetical protein JQ621_13020 [Bradyrhizobium manausense]|uniref:hypothetical protein n=1 Tax=Bradyrhizobium manausense TaxID=989370 RepID=UPI001BA6751B|nr:hypothetical protein [Bradyrhizobium manausense]MBR1088386.1 hypothetical protein [Bradyrhizobium manausense]
MSYSIHDADRATHRKIVVVALLVGVTVSALSLCLHLHAKLPTSEATASLKAGRPLVVGSAVLTVSR